MHLWEQWNSLRLPTYRDVRPRFVAEFGWQGRRPGRTLARAVSDDPLTPESPGMIVHQKAIDGNGKLASGLLPHYRVPDDMETWHWAMQLNQANAVRVRARAVPVAGVRTPPVHDRLAAQRLLAGHLVGGDRRGRTGEAALLRPEERVRTPARHGPATW